MREIKFRAWSRKFGGMIYPNSEYSINVHSSTVWKDARDDESAILMQFTGLKDKNGKEIYEGDIVQLRRGSQYEVKWNDNEAMWWLVHAKRECDDYGLLYTHNIWLNEPKEIIGNIYEHGHLLNNGKQ